MKHGSLFSGIGGFDLAAQWMGWENIFHCEKEPFCQKVLKHHFPNSIQHHDIKETDFTQYRGSVDIISGGFPCQPFSQAGLRKGTEDDRHLWPEMLRAIKEIKPRWIVGENVRGLVNWSGGLVFEQVFADLEAQGYEVGAYLLPAVAVNAPHRRDRIWFVAHFNGTKQKNYQRGNEVKGSEIRRDEKGNVLRELHGNGITPNTNSDKRPERRMHQEKGKISKCDFSKFNSWHDGGAWQKFPTQSPICSGNDGISYELDGITFSKWRKESIKAYGNAVVPQVVYQIFKSIQEYEDLHL